MKEERTRSAPGMYVIMDSIIDFPRQVIILFSFACCNYNLAGLLLVLYQDFENCRDFHMPSLFLINHISLYLLNLYTDT